jgi:glucose/arabinose dehydrogenase
MARVGMRFVATLAALAAALGVAGSGAARPDAGFRARVVVAGLSSPVQVTSTQSAPQRLYVVEQIGKIRVLQSGRLRPGAFLDVGSKIVSGGEQGLLGLAFDPRYASNRFIYVNYTDKSGATNVVRYRTDGTRALPATAHRLLLVPQPYANHNGGNLVFGPDGYLYVGLGDGGAGGDPEDRAQDMSSLLGKLLRLDVRRPGSKPVIVALGLRNPWRYSFDRKTGDLYIGDVGQGSTEEIDFTPRVSPGLENYGWDLYEGSKRFEDSTQGPGRLVMPVFEYGHDSGCSVTGGFVYRGKALPAQVGRYVFGDYCSGSLGSFRISGGRVVDLRDEVAEVPELSSFGEGPAGELYATSLGGILYRLS